ncbi:hypothetical protein PybrP1_006389 [[Pythium] brassicae (nom. inval.)]|nr:hypothetical protein PybrP1_006389 [[Pythium] brassicae (nom. inval.)]
MSTNFSDAEDRRLVALALAYQRQRRRIAWTAVAFAMRRTRRSPLELRERVKTLKRTHGADLVRFPASLLPLGGVTARSLDPDSSMLELEAAEAALIAIFGAVTPREIRHVAGDRHLNAGELVPLAVDAVIRTADVSAGDVFVDVGSGVGNVVAQVALQTRARKCIGVEIRRELCVRGQQLMRRCELRARLLPKVAIVCGDAVDVCLATTRPMNESTVVYLNNILFQAATNVHLTAQLCALPRARVIAATAVFCARHREPCRTAFCRVWELFTTERVPASWTAELVCVYFYRRRQQEVEITETATRVGIDGL